MLCLQIAIKDGGVQTVVSPAQFTVSVDIVLPVMVAVCGAVIHTAVEMMHVLLPPMCIHKAVK
jgi:hypothetical protein